MGVASQLLQGAPASSEPAANFLRRNAFRGKYCYRSILYLGSPRIAAIVHRMHNEIFFPFFAKKAIFMLNAFPCHADTVLGGVKPIAGSTHPALHQETCGI
jgi:hypothetical protein